MGESHYEKVLKGFIIHNIHRVNVTSTYLEKKRRKLWLLALYLSRIAAGKWELQCESELNLTHLTEWHSLWETWRRLTTQTGQAFNSEFITSANLQNRTWVKHVDLFACLSFLNVWYASRHNNDSHFCGVGVSNGTETQFTLFAMVRLLCSVFLLLLFLTEQKCFSCFCNFVLHTDHWQWGEDLVYVKRVSFWLQWKKLHCVFYSNEMLCIIFTVRAPLIANKYLQPWEFYWPTC